MCRRLATNGHADVVKSFGVGRSFRLLLLVTRWPAPMSTRWTVTVSSVGHREREFAVNSRVPAGQRHPSEVDGIGKKRGDGLHRTGPAQRRLRSASSVRWMI
jgi:hypothetical protein